MSSPLIFIVGSSRSGTTMLGRMLGKHSRIHVFGELHYFEHQVSSRSVQSRYVPAKEDMLNILERLTTSARDGLFERVIQGKYRTEAESLYSGSHGKDVVSLYEFFLRTETQLDNKDIPCEQTPRYIFYAEDILAAFPGAIIINMVRDPRDVLLSQKNKWKRRALGAKNIPLREAARAWINYHPYIIAKLWSSAVHMSLRFAGHPRFVSIRFEDLLADPEVTIRGLCSFIGIAYEDQMLSIPQVGSSNRPDDPGAHGVDKGRSGNWDRGGLELSEIAVCQNVAGELMDRLGYNRKNLSVPVWERTASMMLFAVKGVLALLVNAGRSKNMYDTIRRRIGIGGGAR